MITVHNHQLAGDLLRGAGEIAEFLFGSCNNRRKIYYLVERGVLPVFRLGCVVCARKSTLAAWIGEQEEARAKGGTQGNGEIA